MSKFKCRKRQRLVQETLGPDWVFEGVSGGGSLRWRHIPTGQRMTTSATPKAGGRAAPARQQARRVLEAAQPHRPQKDTPAR
jgi:hypothetical protein